MWHFAIEAGATPASIGPDGTIYVGSNDRHLYALNDDGTLKWKYGPAQGDIASIPTATGDGTIYVGHSGSTNGNLLAINADGSLQWVYPAREVRSSPAVGADGTIYVGGLNARLHAINPDGSAKWIYHPGLSETYSSPAIGNDGTIYIAGTSERNLHAVNPDGTSKWTYPVGASGDTIATPTVGGDGVIYIGGCDDKLYAINPDGTLKWATVVGDVHHTEQSAAIGPDGTVYIITATGLLRALAADDGRILWTFDKAPISRGVPTADANGTIYFGATDGKVYALNSDRSEKWNIQVSSTGLGPAVTVDNQGTLYVSGGAGVHAVSEANSEDSNLADPEGDISDPTWFKPHPTVRDLNIANNVAQLSFQTQLIDAPTDFDWHAGVDTWTADVIDRAPNSGSVYWTYDSESVTSDPVDTALQAHQDVTRAQVTNLNAIDLQFEWQLRGNLPAPDPNQYYHYFVLNDHQWTVYLYGGDEGWEWEVDGTFDWLATPYEDAVAAEVADQGDGTVDLSMTMADDIPHANAVPNSLGWPSYYWKFDSDNDPATGQQPHGIDVLVAIRLEGSLGPDGTRQWNGVIRRWNGSHFEDAQMIPFSRNGPSITSTASISDLNLLSTFSWYAGTSTHIAPGYIQSPSPREFYNNIDYIPDSGVARSGLGPQCAQPAAPKLLIPSNGSTRIDSDQIIFNWAQVDNATEYQIQIDRDETFSSRPIFLDADVADTSYSLVSPSETDDFYWRVRSRRTSGTCDVSSEWSSVRKFSVAYGSYNTGIYRNLFTEYLSVSNEDVGKRLDEAWDDMFVPGSDDDRRLYYEVPDDPSSPTAERMGYILDLRNESNGGANIRSEGMSYGMMIAVQMNRSRDNNGSKERDVFDRLWRFAKYKMQHPDKIADKENPRAGYFIWRLDADHPDHQKNPCVVNRDYNMIDAPEKLIEECTHDGGVNPAPDGDEWIAMALLFAAGRWGNEGDINYQAEANKILNNMRERRQFINDNVCPSGEVSMFIEVNPNDGLLEPQVVFVPCGESATFTNPSYHLPNFYALWSYWAEENKDYWNAATSASRQHLMDATENSYGLAPKSAQFDGKSHGTGEEYQFQQDAWRVAMNIASDWAWFSADERQIERLTALLQFFEKAKQRGVYVDCYSLDGEPIDCGGSNDGPSDGLVAMNAVAGLGLPYTSELVEEFVADLWDLEKAPKGEYRYYHGLLYMLGLLHASGNFRIYQPTPLFAEIGPDAAGVVVFHNGTTYEISFPAEAVSDRTTIKIESVYEPFVTANFKSLGQPILVEARDALDAEVKSFSRPFTITVRYSSLDSARIDGAQPAFFSLDEETGTWVKIPTVSDVENSSASATLDHLTVFSVLMDSSENIYLPHIESSIAREIQ